MPGPRPQLSPGRTTPRRGRQEATSYRGEGWHGPREPGRHSGGFFPRQKGGSGSPSRGTQKNARFPGFHTFKAGNS